MKKNHVKKIHIFIIKYIENNRQLSQMAVHINSTQEYLVDGDSHHAVLFWKFKIHLQCDNWNRTVKCGK